MTIKILDKNTAEQIAAGEVIENPASVVKELVENALDAGATRVDLDIEKGGKNLVSVTDNGRGIAEKDLPLAFKRFATSKITALGDLENLASLGFRGEALPSIAAVARVTLTSRTKEALSGSRITVEGGEITGQEETGAPPGTRVQVRDLFYNTPGRLKFLRADNVETTRISTLVSEMALTNPQTAFILRSGGRTLFSSSGDGSLLHVIGSLYGSEAAAAMLELDRKDISTGCIINGFISAPHMTKSSRRWITLVVNGRLVKDPMIVNALERGYEDILPRQRHPLAILKLTVPPDVIDVNVHPAKIEIRFQKPEVIKGLTFKAVKMVLQGVQKHSLWPEAPARPPYRDPSGATSRKSATREEWKPGRFFGSASQLDSHPPQEYKALSPGKAADPEIVTGREAAGTSLSELRLIGQFMQSYLVAQKGEQLLLIDQHAAHERINYHQLKNQDNHSSGTNKAQLTIPLTLDLPASWCERLPLLLPLLEQAGFKLDRVADNRYQVKAVPFAFRENINQSDLYDLIEDLVAAENEPDQDPRDSILITIACHKSIKAGQALSREEMEQLLRQWEKTPQAGYCPHGRPTVISFDRRDLDKSFQRSPGEGGG